ncbi:hypothetical protein DFH06DRAFT_1002097, partial [Mycena polygramma]
KIRNWFQDLDMTEKQRTMHALRHTDTGNWILEGTEFQEWKEQPGCLWIRGNCELLRFWPGDSGCLISSSRYWEDFGIAYFYFDFRDEKKQLLENMFRSIIMQLSEQSPTPYFVLDEQFESCQGQMLPAYNDLLVMLDAVLTQFTCAYIVLDALDECSEPDRLVEFISTLRGWAKPVHLLVTSQPRTIFLESPVFDGALVVVLEPKKTHTDIMQFVASELELNSKLKHIRKVKDAAPKIVNKSNGMFRMAACLLQELSRTSRINPNLDRILAKLPNDLFGIYARFLQPIDEDDFVYVAALLRWIAFSAEPVTLCQLDEALAINFSKPDQWVFEPENRGMAEVCGLLEGLVTVRPTASTSQALMTGSVVTLAHPSVADYIVSQEFLTTYNHDLTEASSHAFLAQSCVAYLLHFENNTLNADTLPHYPLARYAARFWYHHLLRCHDRGVLQRSTMHLLEQGSPQYTALNCLHNIEHPREGPDWSRHAPSPLALCSTVGYAEGVGFLLEHGADVNAAGGEYGSALQCAAQNGNLDIVRILIKHGADVNAAGGKHGSALEAASAEGHAEIARLLREHEAQEGKRV